VHRAWSHSYAYFYYKEIIVKTIQKTLVTLGPIGSLPAPGTMATLVTLPLAVGLSLLNIHWFLQLGFATIIAVGAYFLIKSVYNFYYQPDPAEIVLDEVAGTLFIFIGLPITWYGIIIGFFLFRLLDISKLFGLTYLERLPGATGIMADDLVAAGLTNLILRLIVPLACIVVQT